MALPSILRASELGCALNCDLNTGLRVGGGTATDDGPRINAWLAGATAAHPLKLIMDGGALVSGIFLPAGGHCSIEGLGWDTGFYQKAGTNNDVIHNGDSTAAVPSDPGYLAPLPARGKNVTLKNFRINGNAGNGTNGNSTTGSIQGGTGGPGTPYFDTWFFGINLMSLDNVRIENVWVFDPSSFHIRLSNVGEVVVEGCRLESPAPGPNTDGLHIDGPANDIRVANCDFNCGDDAIALNCPEGWSGNISGVHVVNCEAWTCVAFIRLYTSTTAPNPLRFIDSVTVTNCTAVCTRSGFFVGEYSASNAESVGSLLVSNCKITAPILFEVVASFGAASFSNVTFRPSNTQASIGLLNTIDAMAGTYAGSSLSFDRCRIYRDATSEYGSSAIVLKNGLALKKLALSGVAVEDASGTAFSPLSELLNFSSGTIGLLVIDAVDPTQIGAMVSAGGFANITAISGPGVLPTGFAIPASAMAKWTPYIDSSTSLPSYKNAAGTVVAL